MKKFTAVFIVTLFAVPLWSQYVNYEDPIPERGAWTIGFLNGGGGLLGADLEILLSEKVGIQGGIGLFSYGAGINYHLNYGGVRTSFINLGYWHQGIGDTYVQSMAGPSYIFRARKIFQLQLGLGAVLDTGPAHQGEEVPVMLLYSAGIYLPFR